MFFKVTVNLLLPLLIFDKILICKSNNHGSPFLEKLIEDIYSKIFFRNLIFIDFKDLRSLPTIPALFMFLPSSEISNFHNKRHITHNSFLVVSLSSNKTKRVKTLEISFANKFSRVLFVVEGNLEHKPIFYYEDIFEYCFNERQLKSLVIFEDSPGVFYFLPYYSETFDVSQVMELDFPQENYFPSPIELLEDKTLNFYCLQHHDFFFFNFREKYSNKSRFGGFLYHFFKSFGSKMKIPVQFHQNFTKSENGTYHEFPFDLIVNVINYDPSVVIENHTPRQLVYPRRTETTDNRFLIASFDRYTWLCILLTIPCFSVYYTLASENFDLSNAALNGMRFYLGQGVRFPRKRNNIFKAFLVIGFMINTLYVNLFGYFSKIHVATLDGYRDKRIVSRVNYSKSMPMMLSTVYTMAYWDWEFIKGLQKIENNFNLMKFDIQPDQPLAFFNLQNAFKFYLREELNTYIFQVYSHGLMQHWKELAIFEIRRNDRESYILYKVPHDLRMNENMAVPFYVLFCGLLFAILCFCFEVLINKQY